MNSHLNSQKIVRFGVMGTARIATKVAAAIHAVENAEVTAIASRKAERAVQWAKQHGAARSYGDYQSLVDDDELDAIYIPLPPSLHAQWTIQCAQAGKHVLCEKPLAMSAAEGAEMAAACHENHVQLMDGVMWLHHPRAAAMLEPLRDGTLGELRRITSAFSFVIEPYLTHNPAHAARDPQTGEATLEKAIAHEMRFQRLLGGGALFDLGWYCVGATLWAAGRMPIRVHATARYRGSDELRERGVDMNLSALLWFDNDCVASFDCGYDLSRRKWLEVAGTAGSIVCDDFIHPKVIARPRFWIHDARGDAEERTTAAPIQEQCMIDDFCRIVRSGRLDDHWTRIALQTQTLCDATHRSAFTGKPVNIRAAS